MDAATVTFPPLEQLRRRRSVKWRLFDDDVLPLPVAEADVDLAPPVRRALATAVETSDTGYAFPGRAVATSLAGFADRRWGWRVDPDRVAVVADVGVGCVEVLRALARRDGPGTVVVDDPVYAPFAHWPAEAGHRLRRVPLRAGRLDLDALGEVFADPAVTAYLLCSPHNPTGVVPTRDELERLVGHAVAHGVTVLADEIHAPLVLPGAPVAHTPFLTVPGAAAVGIAVVSASKTFNLAGLKCAQVVTASAATDAVLAAVPEDVAYRVGHLGVVATLAAYDEGEPWLDALLVALAARRSQVAEALAGPLAHLSWTPPEATYLGWLDCRALGEGDVPAERFLAEGRVALEPGGKFGPAGAGHARINLATGTDLLADALDRMAAVRP